MEVTLVSFKILPQFLAGGINVLKTKSYPFFIRTLCIWCSKYPASRLQKNHSGNFVQSKIRCLFYLYKHVNTM